MKKRLLIAATTMLMIALVGCGKEKTEKYEMETDSGKVTVEVKEDGDISITEEKNEVSSDDVVVYEEGTIPLGTYWREGSNGGYWLKFEENNNLENFFRVQDCNIHSSDLPGTYSYDEETKLYTLESNNRIPYLVTLYVDENDNYNLVVTNIFFTTTTQDELDIDNGIYDKNKSLVDVKLKYERQ